MVQFHKDKQTCRKENGPVWCWGATQHERRGSTALGGSQAALARPDHEAAAPPGHISTNMARSPGSANTNTATTTGSPGLGGRQKTHLKHIPVHQNTVKIKCELHQWRCWLPYCNHSRNWQRSGRTRVRWRPRSGRLPRCLTRQVSSDPWFWERRVSRSCYSSSSRGKLEFLLWNFHSTKYILTDRNVNQVTLSRDTKWKGLHVARNEVFVVGATWHSTGRLSRESQLLHRNSPFSGREQHIETRRIGSE